MARENAANVSAYAGTLQGLARALAEPGHLRMASYEPWLRRLVPLMVAIFMTTLALGAAIQGRDARDRALTDAIGDMELVSTLAANQVNSALAHQPDLKIGDVLDRLLPGRAVTAGTPGDPDRPERLDRRHDAAHGFELARASRRSSRPGTAAHGPSPTRPACCGSTSPTAKMSWRPCARWHRRLANWPLSIRSRRSWPIGGPPLDERVFSYSRRPFVLGVIATAYFWQTNRSVEVEAIHARVHSRIDTALNRGRCGLWDWDLARGRIYWSASMYAMLDMQAQSEFMSFGDINALVHPQDGDLSRLAEIVASSRTSTIDHVFRLRNIRGEWVWLRARAELVREGSGSELHLVGIAVDISDEKKLAERNATADVRLRDAIEAVSEAFVLWDADNRLVTCNSKFLALHELAPEKVRIGVSYAQLIANATPPLIGTQISLGENPRGGARSYEAQLGDGRWLQINERRTKDGGYVSVGTDITTLKRHEEQLMDSERRLMATIADLRRSRQALEAQAQQLAELADRHAGKAGRSGIRQPR